MQMVIVVSADRRGASFVFDILSGSSILVPSNILEQELLNRDMLLPHMYLAKYDTSCCSNFGLFGNFMRSNENTKVIWVVRHPYSTALEKIYNGWNDTTSKDCFKTICWSAYLFSEAKSEFPERVLPIKLEDVILNTRKEVEDICRFLVIPFEEKMLKPLDFEMEEVFGKLELLTKTYGYGRKL